VGLPNVGTRTITASYSGDTNYAVSSGSSAEIVTAIATTTGLTLSTATAYNGGVVTLTVAVSPATVGTVNIVANGTLAGTATTNAAGVATYAYTVPPATVGSFAMSASFVAAGAYGGSTSGTQILTVGPAFELTPSAGTVSVAAGSSASLNLSLLPGGGFSGPVALTCASAVKYVTCAVGSASVVLSGSAASSSTATITVAATTSSVRGVSHGVMLAMLTPFGLLLLGSWKRRMTLLRMALLLLGVTGMAAMSGCGGTTTAASAVSNKPTGTQLVTFTATAVGISQTVQVTVTIQ